MKLRFYWFRALLALVLPGWSACLAQPEIVDDPEWGRAIHIDEQKQLSDMFFTPNGDMFLVSSSPSGHDDDHATRVFDAHSLKLLWQTADPCTGRFDPGGEDVVLYCVREVVVIRDARSGRKKTTFKLASDTQQVFYVSAKRLAALRDTGSIELFDTTQGKRIAAWLRAKSAGGITAEKEPGRAGARLAVWNSETGPQGACGMTTAIETFDYPSGLVRCQIASMGPDVSQARHSNIMAVSAGNGLMLLVDTDSCNALAFVPYTRAAESSGRYWFVADISERRQKRRIVKFDLVDGSWTARPDIPWANLRSIVAGPEQLALGYQAASLQSKRSGSYIVFRPLRQSERNEQRHLLHLPDSLYLDVKWPFRPKGVGEQRVSFAQKHRIDTNWLALRLLPVHGGIVVELGNRSAKPIVIDWSRTTATTAHDGRLCLEHIGCDACKRSCEYPCLANKVAPGATWVDFLSFSKQVGNDTKRVDPFAHCGDPLNLTLGLKAPSGKSTTQQISLSIPCEIR